MMDSFEKLNSLECFQNIARVIGFETTPPCFREVTSITLCTYHLSEHIEHSTRGGVTSWKQHSSRNLRIGRSSKSST